MRGKLTVAEVDCEAHGAICRSQGVTGYPMLFYYNGEGKGSGKTEYTSGRRLDQLTAFVDKVSGPSVFTMPPMQKESLTVPDQCCAGTQVRGSARCCV